MSQVLQMIEVFEIWIFHISGVLWPPKVTSTDSKVYLLVLMGSSPLSSWDSLSCPNPPVPVPIKTQRLWG